LRLLGYGAQGFVVRHPNLFPVLYLIPLLGGAIATLEIMGIDLFAPVSRLRHLAPEPA
jgi:hypothetical protein